MIKKMIFRGHISLGATLLHVALQADTPTGSLKPSNRWLKEPEQVFLTQSFGTERTREH
jgi:hypothetical protein